MRKFIEPKVPAKLYAEWDNSLGLLMRVGPFGTPHRVNALSLIKLASERCA